VKIPSPGASDVAVFRLEGHEGEMPYLTMGPAAAVVEPLDDVAAIGYPFSRLQGGVAIPQAVRGFVRRVGPDMVEVDLPLHPGLSGAPLVNGAGEVVAMASAIYQSPLYGVAAPLESLIAAIDAAAGLPTN